MSGLDYITVMSIFSACLELGDFYKSEASPDGTDMALIDSGDADQALSRNFQIQLLALPDVLELLELLRGHAADETRVISKSSAELMNLGINGLSESLEEFKDKVMQPFFQETLDDMDFGVDDEDARESDIVKAVTSLSELIDELPDFRKMVLPMIETNLPLGSPTGKYIYSPLPTSSSIRLVQLNSRSTSYGSGLRLSLKTGDVSETPAFATLSYTWGKPFAIFRSKKERDDPGHAKIPVVCDDAVLEVQESLSLSILSEIEEAMAPPTELWIDAICINQEDNVEKARQVAMMAQIYSKSNRTLIWLGEEDAFSRTAVGMIRSLATAPYNLSMLAEIPPQDPEEICRLLELPPMTSWPWFSVFAFVNRSWFRRSWVVQEAALSPRPEFLCGTALMPWAAVANACGFIQKTGIAKMVSSFAHMEASETGRNWLFTEDGSYVEAETFDRPESERNFRLSDEINEKLSMGTLVLLITQVRHADTALASLDPQHRTLVRSESPTSYATKSPPEDTRPQSVLDLWELSRMTMCSDPRDKIFAFAQLAHRPCYTSSATSEARKNIHIDYTLPIAEVYLQGAWYTLLSDSNLDLLSRARTPQLPKEHELPSWVPDWKVETGLQDFRPMASRLGWSASGDKGWNVPEASLCNQPRLPVQGVFVGSVTDLVCGDNIDYAQAMTLAGKLPDKYEHSPGGLAPFEVLWRTLALDSADGVTPAPDSQGIAFLSLYQQAFVECLKDTTYGTSGDVDRYYTFVSNYSILPDSKGGQMRFENGQLDEASKKLAKDFERRASYYLASRKLFMTDSKHFGLADGHVAAQDKVFVLLGAATPVILRRSGEHGSFVFVGEVYVHGIMYGEMLKNGEGLVEEIVLE